MKQTRVGVQFLVKTYAGGVGAISAVTFAYGQDLREVGDANPTFVKGRLTSIENGSGKVVYRRIDAMGRPVVHEQTVKELPSAIGSEKSYTLRYGYNLGGLMTSMAYPSGTNSVTFSYDAAGRPASVSNSTGTIVSVAAGTDPVDSTTLAPYAAHGGMQVLVYGGATGQTQQFTRYSNLLQAQRIQVSGANALRLDYDWGPGGKNNGNLRTQTINGAIVQSYEHDRLDRLVKTVEGTWTQQNVFDRYGNRAVLATAAGPYSLTGMTPQVTSATESAVEAVYPTANRWSGSSPDNSGNITGINGATLDYDAENRMTRMVVGGSTTGFGYDGEGRRVWKAVCAGTVAVCKPSTVDASWTVFVYDASGALAAEYATVADGEPAGRKYLVADHLGSTRMTFGAGYATKRYDYMPLWRGDRDWGEWPRE